jgi:hypothetical protein
VPLADRILAMFLKVKGMTSPRINVGVSTQ